MTIMRTSLIAAFGLLAASIMPASAGVPVATAPAVGLDESHGLEMITDRHRGSWKKPRSDWQRDFDGYFERRRYSYDDDYRHHRKHFKKKKKRKYYKRGYRRGYDEGYYDGRRHSYYDRRHRRHHRHHRHYPDYGFRGGFYFGDGYFRGGGGGFRFRY